MLQKICSIPGESKKFKHLEGCGIKLCGRYSKLKTLIHHSKTNSDETTLFGKITHYIDPEIGKMHEMDLPTILPTTFYIISQTKLAC